MQPAAEQIEVPNRKPWLRPLRFGLRYLLIVIAIASAWLAFVSHRARSQSQAIERVRQLRGQMAFDYQLDSKMNRTGIETPPGPDWLIDRIGEDYVRSVVLVNFDEGSDPNDEDLAVLDRLPDLRCLTLMRRKRITDSGLRHLAHLTKLEQLALDHTNIQGDGLEHIQHLPVLKFLSLDKTPLTDVGLEYVGYIMTLEGLLISDTQITDDGLRQLSSLNRLQTLQIRNTSVTDEGIKHLAGLTALTEMLIGGSNVTNDGRLWLRAHLPGCKVVD